MKTLQERFAIAFPPPHRRGLMAEIARVCSVSGPTVTAWFRRPEKVSTIERANAEKLCRHFKLNLSPEWLAEGTGAMRADSVANQALHRALQTAGLNASMLDVDVAAARSTLPDWLLHAHGSDTLFLPDFIVTRLDSSRVYIAAFSSALSPGNQILRNVEQAHPHDFVALDFSDMDLQAMVKRVAAAVSKGEHNSSISHGSAHSSEITQALEMLGRALIAADDLTLDQVRPLLARLVDEPARAPEIVPRLAALLAE